MTCECCGEMLVLDNLELAFRRADVVAALSAYEQQSRCQANDDLCVMDGERFFVRCMINLPLQGRERHYGIGAWAEVSQTDFEKILVCWDDENQQKFPPIAGKLANNVPLAVGSFGCEVAVKLTGKDTRPELVIADSHCSLYDEQMHGISVHRANAYTDVYRKGRRSKPQVMQLVEEPELNAQICDCCGSIVHTYCGGVERAGEIVADYWFRIVDGHDNSYTVAISLANRDQRQVVVLSCHLSTENLTYRILDTHESPWNGFGDYGRPMARDAVLNDIGKAEIFELVDFIAAKDTRLVKYVTDQMALL